MDAVLFARYGGQVVSALAPSQQRRASVVSPRRRTNLPSARAAAYLPHPSIPSPFPLSSGLWWKDPHTEAIRMAQQKAAMRRAGGQDLADTIRNAQMKNIPAAQAEAEANAMSAPRRVRDSAAARNGQLGPESLLGTWVDPRGNTVLVMSTDAYAVRLAAILSRPPRADLHLAMRPLDDGGWTCGNSTLSAETSTAEQLHWVGPDGNWSIWMRGRE
ncbi:unnamed protein product [Prorocentrum cordatum]|uniref:Uncharacterized protein n=1 Tax=Prorocentrum cordatum TaxID=2364126 RepID=A0ABN9YEL9_9DINO|nr:unnamed protein product [Polarella glacialis]